MGGIAGLVCLNGCQDVVHTRLVEEMCYLQTHRGPDSHRVVALGQTVEQVEEFCTGIQINRQRMCNSVAV